MRRGVIRLGDQIKDIMFQDFASRYTPILREALRDVIKKQIFEWRHPVVSYSGFKYRILFYKFGYSPHYAEHVIDPVDGREKLVMCSPHTTPSYGKIWIYDIENDVIEWEVDLKQLVVWSIQNPVMCHMIVDNDNMNPITGSWAGVLGSGKLNANPGDIIAPAPDNTWVVIDRRTKSIKQKITPTWSNAWVHDILPSVNRDGLIVTDYNKGVYKIGFDGSTKWGPVVGGTSAKISRVWRALAGGHNPSYGGDYLVARNDDVRGVYELDDSGAVKWSRYGYESVNNVWLFKPHSAFRLGLAEGVGQLTVVGLEAGGGIVAIDYWGRPRWGIMRFVNIASVDDRYRPTSFGLMETTHVFPTLRGTIGFVDWNGFFGSVVGEILELPYHQTLAFYLAYDHDPGDGGYYYDPPLEVGEWSTVKIYIVNTGSNSLDYTVYGSNYPGINPPADFPSSWKVVASGSVAGGGVAELDVSGYNFIRFFGKRTTAGASSKWRIGVVYRR